MSRLAFWGVLLLGIALSLGLPARGEAAPARARTQAWVVSFHYNVGNLSLEGDSLDRTFGAGPEFRIGHVLESGFIAGLESMAWTSQESDTMRGSTSGTTPNLSRGVRLLTMTATKFVSGGFYARAGGGVSTVRQEFLVHDPAGGPSVEATREDVGFAITVAGGWEYKFRPRLSLEAEAEYARFGAAELKGNHISYGGGISFYW